MAWKERGEATSVRFIFQKKNSAFGRERPQPHAETLGPDPAKTAKAPFGAFNCIAMSFVVDQAW